MKKFQQLDIDLEGMGAVSGVDIEKLKEMIPTESRTTKELLFNASRSVYQVIEKSDSSNEINMASGNMQMKVKFMSDDEIDEVIYLNHDTQNSIEKKGLFG